MSQSLNAVTAPDSYSNNGSADMQDLPVVKKFIIDTANQAIYWQLSVVNGPSGNGQWESSETFMLVGSRVISEDGMVGIRVRAAKAAASLPTGSIQAVFTIRAVY